MILFHDDIVRDGVLLDYTTKNTSFLKMAIILNQMGIRNNKFFLALYDKELRGINPHDLTDPSLELRQRIAYECKINLWYFLREVVRVVSSGTDGIPYILNRANLAQAWIYLNSINGFLTIPRQIGKTIGMIAICLWYLYLAGRKLSWGMFCNGSPLQWDNVKRFKEMRDALPKYLWYPSVADSNNKEGIMYAALATQLQTFLAQADKQAADRLGRGATTASQSWDEIAYFVNNDLSWNSATAALNKAAPDARKAGLPAAVIITTTAGDIDDKWGRYAYNMVSNALRFTDKLYDVKGRTQLMDIVQSNSKNNIIYIEYSYKQLGMTDEWFQEVTRSKDPKIVAKDYLNQWLHGSDNSVIDKPTIDKLVASKSDPVDTTWIESILINWYISHEQLMKNPDLRNKPYAIGGDTSDNVGRDFTTLCMVDPYDLKPVATMRCNSANLMFVAKCVVRFLIDFPRAVFIPERNKVGVFLLDYVFNELQANGINPLKRIYNKYFQEYNPDAKLDRLNFSLGEVRKNFGFTTTAGPGSRDLLYSRVLNTAMKLAAARICDRNLVDELCGLTIRNNRVDHSESGHDDLVIAYLLACFFFIFGNNHRFYGIEMSEVLCNVKNDGELCTPDAKKAAEHTHSYLVAKSCLTLCDHHGL